MEELKPQPQEDRKSQNLHFGDYAKERLVWAALPLATGAAAVAFGRVTKNTVWPLNGSPDLITSLHALASKKFLGEQNKDITQWIKDGAYAGDLINALGGAKKDEWRKDFFNFSKGAEVAVPFSAYHLWHKKEENRLDLQDAAVKLKALDDLKPSDADLRQQNEVMRKEIAFAARQGGPTAAVDAESLRHEGRVAERAAGRAQG